jgi:hypothetical protein
MNLRRIGFPLVAVALLACREPAIGADRSMVFVGTTPCGDRIKKLLRLQVTGADALRWSLTLEKDNKGRVATRYKLQCQCLALPGQNEKVLFTAPRGGSCKLIKGTKADPRATVIELENAFSVVEITTDILQMLDQDGSLMIGTAGYSYTLNNAEAAEKPGDVALALSKPSVSYTNSPLAKGPQVFGIFEGRTPCIGIARELGMPHDAGCLKTKWRITLFQEPDAKTPTTYKIENSFTRGHGREGKWRITTGTPDNPNAVVYSLAATDTEPELCLLKGDDNVLFLLSHERRAMVGHADFSYTLNRRP